MNRRERMEKNGSPDAKRIQLSNTVRSKRQEEGQRSGRYDNRSEEKHQDGRSTKRNTGNNFPFFSLDFYTVTN